MNDTPRVLIWNEYRHERKNDDVAAIYPHGIHETIAATLRDHGVDVRTVTLDDEHHGLTDENLTWADVLIWWGHIAHDEVSDDAVSRVHARVLDGMGFIALHSAHFSKPFKRLMGSSCDLKWREANDRERLWVVAPAHPITHGLGETIELEREEMYGELFDVPPPEELIFISWFTGGEVFRSGCTYTRGRGKIFYFRPGHETHPTYHHPDIQRVIHNAVKWAAPSHGPQPVFGNAPAREHS